MQAGLSVLPAAPWSMSEISAVGLLPAVLQVRGREQRGGAVNASTGELTAHPVLEMMPAEKHMRRPCHQGSLIITAQSMYARVNAPLSSSLSLPPCVMAGHRYLGDAARGRSHGRDHQGAEGEAVSAEQGRIPLRALLLALCPVAGW